MSIEPALYRDFCEVSKRRIADVMHEASRLDHKNERLFVLFAERPKEVLCQKASNEPADIGNFEGVRKPTPNRSILRQWKDLSFLLQPSQGARVNDARTVARSFFSNRTFFLDSRRIETLARD